MLWGRPVDRAAILLAVRNGPRDRVASVRVVVVRRWRRMLRRWVLMVARRRVVLVVGMLLVVWMVVVVVRRRVVIPAVARDVIPLRVLLGRRKFGITVRRVHQIRTHDH